MGFLSSEKAASVMAKVSGGGSGAGGAGAAGDAAADAVPEAGVEAQAPDASDLPAEETAGAADGADEAVDSDAEDADEPTGRIPYSRFKKQVEAKKKAEASAQEARTKVAGLEAKLELLQQQVRDLAGGRQDKPVAVEEPSDDDWLRSLLGDDEPATAPEPKPKEPADKASLEERVRRMEAERAYHALDGEIGKVVAGYEDIDGDELRNTLWFAVRQNPQADLESVAAAYVARVEEIGQRAVERALKARGMTAAPESADDVEAGKPAAAPRPAARSGSTTRGVVDKKEQKPRSVQAATALLRERLGI